MLSINFINVSKNGDGSYNYFVEVVVNGKRVSNSIVIDKHKHSDGWLGLLKRFVMEYKE